MRDTRILRRVGMFAALLLLGAEAFFRWGVGLGIPPLVQVDPATEYELVPSREYRRWGARIVINAHGMRAPDHASLPGPQNRWVLLIGDSVVYGDQFVDQSETIAAQLTEVLAADSRLADCTVLALPMAVSSWGPVNQAAFLRRKGTFGASAAFIVVSAHDLYDVPRPNTDTLIYRLIRQWTALGDAAAELLQRERRNTASPDPRLHMARARLSLIALGEMIVQLRAAGIMPKLVYHPTIEERGGTARRERAVFLDWARARGIETLDLGAEIMATDGYRDAIHPDSIGAERIAKVLARAVAPDLPPCRG